MKGRWYPKTPRMLRTSLTVDRVRGQSLKGAVFFGSGKSLLSSTITPRYSTQVCSKVHLAGLRKYDSMASRSSTSFAISRCRGVSSVVAMSTSSTYMNSSVGYLLVKGRNIWAIARQKVAGELHSPKNITAGSYMP